MPKFLDLGPGGRGPGTDLPEPLGQGSGRRPAGRTACRRPAVHMGWRLALSGLPEGYEVVEHEDGLCLLGPESRVVAEFGPLLPDLEVVRSVAWDDARPAVKERLQPVK